MDGQQGADIAAKLRSPGGGAQTMSPRKAVGVFLLSLALLPCGARATPQEKKGKPSAAEVAMAQRAVEEYLAKVKGTGAVVQPVEDRAVARALPGPHFFAVLFRQYPVARIMPEGLKSSSVFAVGRDN